jgi:hypothetical protein
MGWLIISDEKDWSIEGQMSWMSGQSAVRAESAIFRYTLKSMFMLLYSFIEAQTFKSF